MVLPVSTPVALAIALVGALLATYGGRRLGPELRRLRADPVAVYEAANARGPVELRGSVRPHEDVLEAPFTGRECVAYRFEVEEYESAGQYSHWETLAEDGLFAPFRLEDDSGSILVEPGGDDFAFDDEWSIEVGRDETVQGRAREFLEGVGVDPGEAGEFSIGPVEIGTGDRRRYSEACLEVGDPVAVYGPVEYDVEAGRAGGTGAVNATVRASGGQSLIVAAGDRVPTVRRESAIAGGLVVAGLALALLGLATTLLALGLAG